MFETPARPLDLDAATFRAPGDGANVRGPRRPLIMGIVNVTPDSFSDGGRWFDADAAIAHGRELLAQGADVLDVGGESTRPGAERADEAEELRRVVPVIRALAEQGASVSVDTMRAAVAQAAVEAGAQIINDVSGGLADPRMGRVAAETGALFVAMHWRGHSERMQQLTEYDDLVADVCGELTAAVVALREAGVERRRLVVDPGFGFSKTAAQNWELLSRMDAFDVGGLPVLWGTSRKSFLGAAGRAPAMIAEGVPVPAIGRDAATAATSLLAAQHGAWGVRVHDVASTLAALDVAAWASGASVTGRAR